MKTMMKNKKNVFIMASLAIILFMGLFASASMLRLPVTYDGTSVDLVALYEDPEGYTIDEADGVAAVIVAENLSNTIAENVVTAVVFNFRGYDTMGESFVLITSVTGALVILRTVKKKKKEEQTA